MTVCHACSSTLGESSQGGCDFYSYSTASLPQWKCDRNRSSLSRTPLSPALRNHFVIPWTPMDSTITYQETLGEEPPAAPQKEEKWLEMPCVFLTTFNQVPCMPACCLSVIVTLSSGRASSSKEKKKNKQKNPTKPKNPNPHNKKPHSSSMALQDIQWFW